MPKKKPASKRKRAANGQGSISQRADGRYKIDVSLGYNPTTGKAIRKSVYGWTQDEALSKAQKLRVQASGGIYKEPSKLTVAEWCSVWLKEYTGHLAPRTKRLYQGDVNNYIIPRLGRYKLHVLNRAMVQRFVNSLTSHPLDDKAISPKTVKNVHGTLNRLLNQAVDIDYLIVNPATKCKLPRIEKVQARALSKKEITAFQKLIEGHHFELEYLLTLYTGIREGELLGLKWDAVDMDHGTIVIKRQLQKVGSEYQLLPPKANKVRTIHLGQLALNVLRRQKRTQNEWRLRAGSSWEDKGYVFTNEIGEHIKRQTIYKQFKDIVTTIGCPDATIHSLRHTYATTAMQMGIDPKSIQESMGHYSSAFTIDQYGHAMKDVQMENASKLDSAFSQLK